MTTKAEPKVTTIKACLNDESIEAVSLENDKVIVHLKSGSVMEHKCVDDLHAGIRYAECIKSLKYGADKTSEIDDMDDYIKALGEAEEESSSDA